jgi:uncharacterized protein YbdZ (MbtH family)
MIRPWFDIVQRAFDKQYMVWEQMRDPRYSHIRFPTNVEIPKAWVIVFVDIDRHKCVTYVRERLDIFDKENPRAKAAPRNQK